MTFASDDHDYLRKLGKVIGELDAALDGEGLDVAVREEGRLLVLTATFPAGEAAQKRADMIRRILQVATSSEPRFRWLPEAGR